MSRSITQQAGVSVVITHSRCLNRMRSTTIWYTLYLHMLIAGTSWMLFDLIMKILTKSTWDSWRLHYRMLSRLCFGVVRRIEQMKPMYLSLTYRSLSIRSHGGRGAVAREWPCTNVRVSRSAVPLLCPSTYHTSPKYRTCKLTRRFRR